MAKDKMVWQFEAFPWQARYRIMVILLMAAFTGLSRAGVTDGFDQLVIIINSEVRSPGVAPFIGFTAQVKPVRLESTGASVFHTRWHDGDARDR